MNRRRHKRQTVSFSLSCRRLGDDCFETYYGQAINISPSGLYFKTDTSTICPGTLLEVEFTIPPQIGRLERIGRMSVLGRVVRTEEINNKNSNVSTDTSKEYGIAVEFSRPPRLAL